MEYIYKVVAGFDWKVYIFPIDFSMGWLKVVRASKLWKLPVLLGRLR